MTAQFGFMRGVAGKNCQICQTTMDAEINRWPKRSDRLRNHDQRTQEELRYAPSYPRHFDFHRRNALFRCSYTVYWTRRISTARSIYSGQSNRKTQITAKCFWSWDRGSIIN